MILGAILLFPAFTLCGQRAERAPKHYVAIEIGVGHSFPAFDRQQTQWKGTFYPAGAVSVLFVNRLGPHWTTDFGFGLTGYALTNRGPFDKYVLDFASPHLQTGLAFSTAIQKGREGFLKMTTGLQLGYRGTFVDEFDAYRVTVEGNQALYYFLRPEIGMRGAFRKKIRGARSRLSYEFGTFYRHNFVDLGSARIEQPGFDVTLRPRGHLVGGYFKLLFPSGRQKIRLKEVDKPLPPVIYNPRFRD